MFKNPFNKKPETKDQLIVRWADLLILDSDYKGKIDTTSFLLFDGLFHPDTPTEEEKEKWKKDRARKIRTIVLSTLRNINRNLDIPQKELGDYQDRVKLQLLHEGYIHDPITTNLDWLLTDKGKLVKELGGHKEYKKHRRRELHILRNQNKINWLLFAAAVASAIMPFVVAMVFPPKTIVNYPAQNQSLSHNDSDKLHHAFSADSLKTISIQEQAKPKQQRQTK